MIKAAFFDVDGTLYSHNIHGVPESNIKALEELRKRGILVFLATGRHFTEIHDLKMDHIAFDGYVMLTGQLCTDGEKNVIFGNAIKPEMADYLFNAFETKELPLMMVEKDSLYVNMINEVVEKAQEGISSPVPPVGEYNGAPIYQMVSYGGKDLEELLAEKVPECKVTRWSPFGVDIISKSGGKVVGIEKMLEHYGLTKEEMIAFGDGENDLEMLAFAGIGVAMGNAEEEVKAAADYVTEDIDDEGILKACKHFGLI